MLCPKPKPKHKPNPKPNPSRVAVLRASDAADSPYAAALLDGRGWLGGGQGGRLDDGHVHTVRVTFLPTRLEGGGGGELRVYVDDMEVPALVTQASTPTRPPRPPPASRRPPPYRREGSPHRKEPCIGRSPAAQRYRGPSAPALPRQLLL